MTERQKEFLRALADCGISINTLIVVGSLITTEPLMAEMCKRILKAEESGQKVSDGLVGQVLIDMMNEAMTEK